MSKYNLKICNFVKMNKNIIVIGGVGLLVLLIVLLSTNKPNEEKISVKNEGGSKTKVEEAKKLDHHLHDAEISVKNNSLSATLNSIGLLPLKGESGAIGYGLITDKGTDAIIVSTTHGGVLDSEKQKDAADPVWHNHMVKLGEVAICGENPGVIDITFESPGEVKLKNQALIIADAPSIFTGKHSLTNKEISFAHGTNVEKVVQFNLEPKFNSSNELQAVCVTHIEEVPFKVI